MTLAQTSRSSDVRHVMRANAVAALGTRLRGTDGEPYVSLAPVAWSYAGDAVLLLSDLAEHSRNIAADNRVSLLCADPGASRDPLAADRVTVQGRIMRVADERLRSRYLARHPEAKRYAGFGDFGLYCLTPDRVHLIAGFGRIHWIEAAELFDDLEIGAELAEREVDIVDHMNDDHADAIQLYADVLLGRSGDGWRMTGIDPDGVDLRRDGETARVRFDAPVRDAESARIQFVQLAQRARAQRTRAL